MEGLTEGRIVHYRMVNNTLYSHDHDCYVAVVSRVRDKDRGIVDLHIFVNSSEDPVRLYRSVSYAETPTEGHWHWIERA